MKTDKNALVISFYTNLPGSCQAEWVDDRMNALIAKGFKITLISSRGVFKHENDSIRHIRIPCINPHGAKSELNEIESRKIKINLLLRFYYRVMAFIDFIMKKIGWRHTIKPSYMCSLPTMKLQQKQIKILGGFFFFKKMFRVGPKN